MNLDKLSSKIVAPPQHYIAFELAANYKWCSKDAQEDVGGFRFIHI